MTEKLIFLVGRKAGLSRDEFRRRYLEVHAPLFLRHCRALRGYAVNLVEGRRDEGVDAVAEMWFDALEDFRDPGRLYDSPEGVAAVARDAGTLVSSVVGYRVDEAVQRDYERTWPAGAPSPGAKLIGLLRRTEAMTHEQFAEHWLHTHAPLALKHVLGMTRYVINVVREPLTPGAPEVDGIVEVQFATLEDLRNRRYDSPEGEAVIAADNAKFLANPTRYRTTEYVLKSERPPT